MTHRAFSGFAIALASSLTIATAAHSQSPSAKPVVAPAPPAPAMLASSVPDIALTRVLPDLATTRPIQMLQRPDAPNEWYLVEQPGTVRLVDLSRSDLKEAPLVVDLRDRVTDKTNEEGMLSLAFHPDFPTKREVFIYYSALKPRRSVLSRFTVSADGRSIDPKSEEVLLETPQPYWNHNGGTALFGPDGFLYLSLGDGGAANDPHENGQSLKTHLAKVLRIDVNKKDAGKPYAVPADNPFVGNADALPEIWAYGLRNVWRMQFDRKTGDLWAGDVGQNAWEEIDLIRKGGNYGWNKREGFHDFAAKEKAGFIDPVVDYSHKEGVSVTGGYVYRGTEIKGLDGAYLYADFGIPKIWGIRMIGDRPSEPKLLIQKGGSLFSSFAEAKDGTLYVLSFEGGQNAGQQGAIWKIVGR